MRAHSHTLTHTQLVPATAEANFNTQHLCSCLPHTQSLRTDSLDQDCSGGTAPALGTSRGNQRWGPAVGTSVARAANETRGRRRCNRPAAPLLATTGLRKCTETLAWLRFLLRAGWGGFTDRVKPRTTVQQCASLSLYFLLLSSRGWRPALFSLSPSNRSSRGGPLPKPGWTH